ncbi:MULTISPECIES: hypothetical protein [unclassified Microbacterium]|uniref:hypothetical protein n=1 Tax=unclassified Microbacterium TaxID=2609290 RepID=UPI001AEEFE00|nr:MULTISPECIES: hypothetical protein [unclassified Microbacterium]QYM63430.1 hypothetical protein K1X59_14595 [Microbacterium sp. Se5.02b]
MTPELPLPQRVAAEVRAEMGWQKKPVRELAEVLDVVYRGAKQRYDGDREYQLDELPKIAEWLGVSVSQLTTGRRDRERQDAA